MRFPSTQYVMQFITIVEVKLRECIAEGREVQIKAYVTKAEDEELIIGASVLKLLGYRLVREAVNTEVARDQRSIKPEGSPDAKKSSTVAAVVRRAYVAPNTVQWISLNWCSGNADCMLNSSTGRIFLGVCRPKTGGVVEVPVVNRSSEPYVFQEGEKVGNWINDPEEWEHASTQGVPIDLLRADGRVVARSQDG
ncbi:unnamed protein product [Heligmosomoides polygyrus]|uniref:PPM-type phosphatase domain-containing protein n=1 Tax=Heligmosomoides polygyrus TaxID=6339 RepID=A0A183FMB0_HELPZ|nr:unnamed protein product [Heligmosomoides polygyrus]